MEKTDYKLKKLFLILILIGFLINITTDIIVCTMTGGIVEVIYVAIPIGLAIVMYIVERLIKKQIWFRFITNIFFIFACFIIISAGITVLGEENVIFVIKGILDIIIALYLICVCIYKIILDIQATAFKIKQNKEKKLKKEIKLKHQEVYNILNKLKELKDSDALTESEYEDKKNKYIKLL